MDALLFIGGTLLILAIAWFLTGLETRWKDTEHRPFLDPPSPPRTPTSSASETVSSGGLRLVETSLGTQLGPAAETVHTLFKDKTPRGDLTTPEVVGLVNGMMEKDRALTRVPPQKMKKVSELTGQDFTQLDRIIGEMPPSAQQAIITEALKMMSEDAKRLKKEQGKS